MVFLMGALHETASSFPSTIYQKRCVPSKCFNSCLQQFIVPYNGNLSTIIGLTEYRYINRGRDFFVK